MGKNKKNAIDYAQNLSHELLTPLAVIRNNAELLLQSPNLQKDDLKYLDDILKNVRRMNNLNKSLILLSKIDNEVYEYQKKRGIYLYDNIQYLKVKNSLTEWNI